MSLTSLLTEAAGKTDKVKDMYNKLPKFVRSQVEDRVEDALPDKVKEIRDAAVDASTPHALLGIAPHTPTRNTQLHGTYSTGPDEHWGGVITDDQFFQGDPRRYSTDIREHALAPYEARGINMDLDELNKARKGIMYSVPGRRAVSTKFSQLGRDLGPATIGGSEGPVGLADSESYDIDIPRELEKNMDETFEKHLPALKESNPKLYDRLKSLAAMAHKEVNGVRGVTMPIKNPYSVLSHEQNHAANMLTPEYVDAISTRQKQKPGFAPFVYANKPGEGVQSLASLKRAVLARTGKNMTTPEEFRRELASLHEVPADRIPMLRAEEDRLRKYLQSSVKWYNLMSGAGMKGYPAYEGPIEGHPVFKNIADTYSDVIPLLVQNEGGAAGDSMGKMASYNRLMQVTGN